MTDLTVLDCTLRDGGYYNDWDFAPDLVRKYLESAARAGIDVVEIGFRFPAQKRFLGAYAYCLDPFLDTLDLPDGMDLGVMINAANFTDGGPEVLGRLFAPRGRSRVGLVRIAVHLDELGPARPLAEQLKRLGYRVGVNLMQVAERAPETLAGAAGAVSAWGAADVLYFADSLGSMDARRVGETIGHLRQGWNGPIGIHAHDNMSGALTNTLAALESGATWLDATLAGMGRGSGNARMEYLLIELGRRGHTRFHADSLFPLVLDEFEELRRRFQWGPNLFYFLSGAYGIHPYYVQEMLSDGDRASEHALAALERLKGAGANSYSAERLRQAMLPAPVSFEGSWNCRGWAEGRTVLIVAASPWVRRHVQPIAAFIDQVKPLVISLNTGTPLPKECIDAFLACSELRFAMEADHYLDLSAPLIAPLAAFPAEVRRQMEGRVHDYGLATDAGRFAFGANCCVVPRRLAAAYALALCNAAGASRILLAGFDGYGEANPLQREMDEVFAAYAATPGAAPLSAITPTTYTIPQSSLFSPEAWT